MHSEQDLAYYRMRASREQEQAGRATDPAVRRTHHRLAELYLERLRETEISPEALPMLLTSSAERN